MKSANQNSLTSNLSTRNNQVSKRSRARLSLTFAATVTLLCGAVLSSLSTTSLAQQGAQTTLAQESAKHPDWVQIPGELIRPDCIHEIPSGATVVVGKDGQVTGDVAMEGAIVAHYDACPEAAIVTRPRARTEGLAKTPGTGNGWVEADQWNVPLSASDDIDYMAGQWTVPSKPTVNGALIYLFNGIEPSSGAWILQPVLQYGAGPAGGGNYWAIASWLVSNTQAFHSPLETVYPGNSITGYTEMTGKSGNTKYWTVEAKDSTTGAYSYLNAYVSGQHWTWAYAGVLEAYNVTSCSQFPASGREVFKGSVVDHGFPYYNSASPDFYGAIYNYGGPSCHFAVVAVSGTLDF